MKKNIIPQKKKVFIVDDHPVVRRGLTECINGEEDLIVCGDAEGSDDAIRRINELNPDVVILDISLNGENGLDLAGAIKSRFKIPILVLSMHEENFYAERAIRAGAKGYIMKREPMAEFLHAIHTVLGGKIYLGPRIKDILLGKLLEGTHDNNSLLDSLANREMDVFCLIGEGLSNKHIADRLGLSVKTIETYRSRLIHKLNLRNSAELAQFAVQWSRKIGNPM